MPKKRVLPYIILGILKQNPDSTGKELTNQFQNEIGEFWRASHSQIYPELKKMLADEWITGKQKENNEKEIHYSLTKKGSELLEKWIDQPLTGLPVNQDLFSLKLFFINDKNDPRIKELISKEKALITDQLAHLQARKKLLFSDPDNVQKNYGHYLILMRAISRNEGQLEWLNSL
ncbi:PadR family transcriptional regulator [Lactobacillus amylovorus]|uniref:PadR family transcriptional regulator n=1 Tax=Lactobacillus amylovorus TaxID=1604 RepID=UPI00201DE9E7|nr:PadR family transcriptional regulator [Lactobacillus amylovorus]